MTGDPAQDVPAGDVPPDQTLRHLWLVRAQLAAHLDTETTKSRMKYPGVDALVMVSLGLAGCAALSLVSADESPGDRLVVGPILAGVFLLWPFTRSLLTCTEVFRLVAKRKQALKQAEAHFMALDAQRPGGPLGGPAVQAGELPYVPPSVPPGRLQ